MAVFGGFPENIMGYRYTYKHTQRYIYIHIHTYIYILRVDRLIGELDVFYYLALGYIHVFQ